MGGARMGIRDRGRGLVPGPNKRLPSGGMAPGVVAAGALIVGDRVRLNAPPLADLAVSLYLPSEVLANFQITGRYARQTNYISPAGNFANATVMPVGNLTDQWFFVSGVDVVAPENAGGGVAPRGSLTDGNISTITGFFPWPGPLRGRAGELRRRP